jgi:uncharacterized protein YcgI (DUF1989 family)
MHDNIPDAPSSPTGAAHFDPTIGRHRIEPQHGAAFELRRGQVLKVIDPRGEQVSDLIAYARDDWNHVLSSGRTLDYNNTIYLTAGHQLYSNRSAAMFTIVADTVGRHDFLYTPCIQETFTIIYQHHGHHPSCAENLSRALAAFGPVHAEDIPTTFNIFMNVEIGPTGELHIAPPRSRPGDFIELRAEIDVVVGLTACSAEMSNNYAFKPIEYEIR